MNIFLSFNPCGTSPRTIRCASPSTTAVFPTPGSPIRTGLFFVFLERIRITFLISLSLPITGSSFWFLGVKVQGGRVYVGKDLNQALISAEDEAKQLGDEYVSVEHLFLAMIKHPNKEIKEIFREYGITRERFLQVLSTVRGNQRVTSDNPEATYDITRFCNAVSTRFKKCSF